MCGIALVLSDIQIEGHLAADAAIKAPNSPPQVSIVTRPTIQDLCEALRRRGPDHLGTVTLKVTPKGFCKHVEVENKSCARKENGSGSNIGVIHDDIYSKSNGSDETRDCDCVSMEFAGASLQLRGDHPVFQPLRDSLGNLLVYNGEVFGGLQVRPGENDTEIVMAALRSCCTCPCHASYKIGNTCNCSSAHQSTLHKSVPQMLSCLRGPWALIYWQAESHTLWFGRDAIGRRSLLLHRPSCLDPRLLLTSVATAENPSMGEETSRVSGAFEYWEELPCGIHSILLATGKGKHKNWLNPLSTKDGPTVAYVGQLESSGIVTYRPSIGWAKLHDMEDHLLRKLIAWDRQFIDPHKFKESLCLSIGDLTMKEDSIFSSGRGGLKAGTAGYENVDRGGEVENCLQNGLSTQGSSEREVREPVQRVLGVLRQAVKRRTSDIRRHSKSSASREAKEPGGGGELSVPVALLFSGGLDSMILAALADECIHPDFGIDLLNVSFEGASAPDRITAIAGVAELRQLSPSRRWRLVEVDGDLAAMDSNQCHLRSLICPSNTYMDFNIGTALWLAAKGEGWVHDTPGGPNANGVTCSARTQFKSEARVLLVGAGADEQCGGYGRHRTKFRLGGWEALHAEMRIDMHRIWKRNLGRDDRCIADVGKEARFPFLDEDLVDTLLDLPLWEVVDLQQPLGVGDKKILRDVALSLGLTCAAALPKRAIQFGSRIARESNKREFGSNRAANQASAGSALLPGPVGQT